LNDFTLELLLSCLVLACQEVVHFFSFIICFWWSWIYKKW